MLGQILGSYKIVEQIGEGGMGAVYSGEHTQIGRKVAIKVLLPELANSAEIVQRFFNEAKATTAINHPGIVEVYDYGHAPTGAPYIVMEFLQGEPLQTRLERDIKLASPIAVGVMKQIASALGAAHGEGIVHRDLKPENVYLLPDPLNEVGVRAKLLDFGIAKLDEELRGGLDPTRAGAVLGTPQYMSPEQCTGSTALDHRSDMYALGCVLYHMLCGRPPFTEHEFGKIAIKHLSATPPKPTELEPSVTPELEAILAKLLEKQPEDRFQSCGQLVDALDGKQPRAPTPVPPLAVLPPGARTFVPGEMGMMAKELAAALPKKKKRTTPPMGEQIPPGGVVSSGTPLPQSGPVPLSGGTPLPQSGPVPLSGGTPLPQSGPVPLSGGTPLPQSGPIPLSGPTPLPQSGPVPLSGPTPAPQSGPTPEPLPVREKQPTLHPMVLVGIATVFIAIVLAALLLSD